jgi:hypothetical protein
MYTGINPSFDIDYCVEAKRLFNAMTIIPDVTRKKLIDYTIRQLKIKGIWDRLEFLYLFAANNSQAGRLNWKNPGLYTATEVLAPVFTTDQGYTPNGSTSFLKTGFIPSINLTVAGLNDISFGLYSRTDVARNANDIGCVDATSTHRISMNLRNSTGNLYVSSINNSSGPSIANLNSLGFHYSYRSNSTNVVLGKNGIDLSTSNVVSVALPSVEMYIGGMNNNGSLSGASNRQFSFSYLGNSAINFSDFYSIIQNYMTQIGANV